MSPCTTFQSCGNSSREESSQVLSESSHARIDLDFEQPLIGIVVQVQEACFQVVSPDHHRPELEHPEASSANTDSRLTETPDRSNRV